MVAAFEASPVALAPEAGEPDARLLPRAAAIESDRRGLEIDAEDGADPIEIVIVLPKRWIVERTFGWVNRARRLAKDFEALISSSQAWFMLSMAFLLVRRLSPGTLGKS
jgi:transposase